jgi:hypothetical protein
LREPDDPEIVLVMLFPEDPARWQRAVQTLKEMRAQPGPSARVTRRARRTFTFSLGPVVPGRHLIAAVPSPEVMVPTEPAVVERLRPFAVPVTLVAGETAKVEVPVSRPQQSGKAK